MHRNKRTNHIKNRGSRFLCSSVFCFCIGYIMPLRLCIPLCSSDRRLSNRYLKQQRTHQRVEAISAADRREAAAKMQVRFEKTGFLFGKGAGLLLSPVSDGAETASAAGPQHSLCHRIYIAVTDGRLSNTYEHDFGREKSQSAKSSAKIFINFSRKIK